MAEGRDIVKLEPKSPRKVPRGSPREVEQPTSAAFAPVSSDAQMRSLLGGGAAASGATNRLGSIRPKPDLTLGGAAKPKFKPKVPGRRKAKAKPIKAEGGSEVNKGPEPASVREGRGSGRGRGRGQSAFARGRGRRPQPQSQTVFGAGSFVKPARRTPRPGGSSSSSSSPKSDKAANERKAEQERIDAAPVDFGEVCPQSPRSSRSGSKSKGRGSAATVKREEGEEPLLDPESSDEEDFEQYFGAQSATHSARNGQHPPTWLPLSKTSKETVPPPVGSGPDVAGTGTQFGAGASGKLQPRQEIPVASDFVKLEQANKSAAEDLEEDTQFFFMQMPSHLPLHHYQPPASLRPGVGDTAASAVDLEAEDLRKGGEAAAAARMQQAMTAYESHHKLEPVSAYEKTQALRDERKRRELEIVESRKHGVGVDGWAHRSSEPLASGECAAPGAYLRQPAVPSGKIGKMRIHKSGKVTMLIGDVMCVPITQTNHRHV